MRSKRVSRIIHPVKTEYFSEPAWKNFITFFPIIYVALVLWGILTISIFYNQFGVNIIPYLDFDELLLAQYGEFFLTLGLIIASCLSVVFAHVLISGFRRLIKKVSFLAKIKFDPLSFLMLILTPVPGLIYILFKFPELNIFHGVFFMITGVFFQFFFDHKTYAIPLPNFNKNRVFVYPFAVIVFIMSLIIPLSKSYYVIESTKLVHVQLYDETPIRTGEEFRFIGETKNYLFIYDQDIDKTIIIKRNDIKKLEFYFDFNKKFQPSKISD